MPVNSGECEGRHVSIATKAANFKNTAMRMKGDNPRTQVNRPQRGIGRFGRIGLKETFSGSAPRSQIARTRADFDRFSEMSENLETEMWSRVDLNSRPPLRLFIAKLSAHLATNSRKIKATMLQRQSSPALRHFFPTKDILIARPCYSLR